MQTGAWFSTFDPATARSLLGSPLRFVRPDRDNPQRGVVVYVAGGDTQLWALAASWDPKRGPTPREGPSTADLDIWAATPQEGVTDDDGYLFRGEARDVPLLDALVALACLERGDPAGAAAVVGSRSSTESVLATEVHHAIVGRYGSLATARTLTAEDLLADARQAIARPRDPDPTAVLLANARPEDIWAGWDATPPENASPTPNHRTQELLALADILQWWSEHILRDFIRLGRWVLSDLAGFVRGQLPDFDPASDPRIALESARRVSEAAEKARLLYGVLEDASGRRSA